MKKAIYTVFMIDCIYILISSVASLFRANYQVYLILKYAALLLPLVALIFVVRRGEYKVTKLLPDKSGVVMTLPLIAPSILLVMGISWVTTLLLSLVTTAPVTSLNMSGSEFLLHALIPSFFEELVFRLVPLVILAPHSKKSAVLVSSLLFAFIHFNPYQIPYALFAGALYMAVDVAFSSPLLSIVMHLLNNTVALLWQNKELATPILIVLSAVALVSVSALFLARRKYAKSFAFLSDKNDRADVPLMLVVLVFISFAVAFITYV